MKQDEKQRENGREADEKQRGKTGGTREAGGEARGERREEKEEKLKRSKGNIRQERQMTPKQSESQQQNKVPGAYELKSDSLGAPAGSA